MRYSLLILFILSFFISLNAFSQSGKITGKVVSGKTGEPLIGASISVEGKISLKVLQKYFDNLLLKFQ
jgi:hypothetical protein